MPASYPTSIKTYTVKLDGAGNIIFAAHVNELQDEVTAIETGLISGLQHHFLPTPTATRDIGSSTLGWRDLFLTRTITSTQGTITANAPVVSHTATWNSAGVTFVGYDSNVVDTASAVGSFLARLQVGGANKFLVRKDGAVSVGGNLGANERFNVAIASGFGATISGGTGNDGTTALLIVPATTTQTGPIIRGLAGQSGDLLQTQNSASAVLFSVGATGTVLSADSMLPRADNVPNLGSATQRWAGLFVGNGVVVGTNPSLTGNVRLPSTATIAFRNAANTSDIPAITTDAGDSLILRPGPGATVASHVDGGSNLGSTTVRWAQLFINNFIESEEIADPAAPGANKGRLYFKDNGAGKTQLVVRFNTGAVQVIATEP